jgi:hypothetical protein
VTLTAAAAAPQVTKWPGHWQLITLTVVAASHSQLTCRRSASTRKQALNQPDWRRTHTSPPNLRRRRERAFMTTSAADGVGIAAAASRSAAAVWRLGPAATLALVAAVGMIGACGRACARIGCPRLACGGMPRAASTRRLGGGDLGRCTAAPVTVVVLVDAGAGAATREFCSGLRPRAGSWAELQTQSTDRVRIETALGLAYCLRRTGWYCLAQRHSCHY